MSQIFEYQGGNYADGCCFWALVMAGRQDFFIRNAPGSLVQAIDFAHFSTEIDFFKVFLKWRKRATAAFLSQATFYIMLFPDGKEITIRHPQHSWQFKFTGKFLTDKQIRKLYLENHGRLRGDFPTQAVLPKEELARIVKIAHIEPQEEHKGRKLYKEG